MSEMAVLHPVDVYAAALDDYGNNKDALRTLANYVEDLSYNIDALPWGEWFAREDKEQLEELCQRIVSDTDFNPEMEHFWAGMGHWSPGLRLDEDATGALSNNAAMVPEQAWHDLVDHQGADAAMELLRTIQQQHNVALLETMLVRANPSVALALRLGMFHDDTLAQEQGLQGQSMHFWAKWVAVGGKHRSWDAFCSMYPWHGPELVHSLLANTPRSGERNDFVQHWVQDYPMQSQALHAFLKNTESPYLVALPKEGQVPESVRLVRQQLQEGLYPPSTSIGIFVEQYSALFAHAPSMTDMHLPDLGVF